MYLIAASAAFSIASPGQRPLFAVTVPGHRTGRPPSWAPGPAADHYKLDACGPSQSDRLHAGLQNGPGRARPARESVPMARA